MDRPDQDSRAEVNWTMQTTRMKWIAIAAIVVLALLGAFASSPGLAGAAAPPRVTPPAPTCTANGPVTASQTEGPFYKANSPERASLLEPNMGGTRIILAGYVLGRECRPIARAWLDFWQADDRGEYDNTGFRMRGHQFTDAAGIYNLETVLPGLYTGRTRHIHVKVRAGSGPTLTTQIYFPGEARNQSDGIFNASLIATMRDGPSGARLATFSFVIDAR
jgi:protocatechuate 3,4-dioxygenase beta subunit